MTAVRKRRTPPSRRTPPEPEPGPTGSGVWAAVAAMALGAGAVGLMGVDAGILWIVAAVFTLRSLAGAAPGAAWGIAFIGAGLRWGTLALADVGTATRLFGATVAAGTPVARVGMTTALVGALVEEARQGGLVAVSWLERGAALTAVVALVPAFLVQGPSLTFWSAAVWAAAAGAALAAAMLLRPIATRLPVWLPVLLAVAGVVLSEVGR